VKVIVTGRWACTSNESLGVVSLNKRDLWESIFFRGQIFGEIPKNLGIVEALVFSDKICQQILLGHKNCQVVLLLCYPTFCTVERNLFFWQLFFEHKLSLYSKMVCETKSANQFKNCQAALLLCYPTFCTVGSWVKWIKLSRMLPEPNLTKPWEGLLKYSTSPLHPPKGTYFWWTCENLLLSKWNL